MKETLHDFTPNLRVQTGVLRVQSAVSIRLALQNIVHLMFHAVTAFRQVQRRWNLGNLSGKKDDRPLLTARSALHESSVGLGQNDGLGHVWQIVACMVVWEP